MGSLPTTATNMPQVFRLDGSSQCTAQPAVARRAALSVPLGPGRGLAIGIQGALRAAALGKVLETWPQAAGAPDHGAASPHSRPRQGLPRVSVRTRVTLSPMQLHTCTHMCLCNIEAQWPVRGRARHSVSANQRRPLAYSCEQGAAGRAPAPTRRPVGKGTFGPAGPRGRGWRGPVPSVRGCRAGCHTGRSLPDQLSEASPHKRAVIHRRDLKPELVTRYRGYRNSCLSQECE